MKLLAIDPGDTTGFATWNTGEQLLPVGFGNVEKQNLYLWLQGWSDFQFDQIVCEDYIPRPAKAKGFDHSFAKVNTLRYIGAIEYRAFQLGIDFKLQPASIKPVGAGWGNITHNKKTHAPHHLDAMKHGFYYLVKNEIIKKEELFALFGKTPEKVSKPRLKSVVRKKA